MFQAHICSSSGGTAHTAIGIFCACYVGWLLTRLEWNWFNCLKYFGFRPISSIFREKICNNFNKFLITYIKLLLCSQHSQQPLFYHVSLKMLRWRTVICSRNSAIFTCNFVGRFLSISVVIKSLGLKSKQWLKSGKWCGHFARAAQIQSISLSISLLILLVPLCFW
jgi:hypothetical protein